MGKVGGPMNFGFNSNVRVGDATYHVQTEDRGASHPFLDTVVYLAGRVIYKRSTGYEKFASGMEAANLSQKLHEHLSQQHRDVIAGLEAGTLPMNSKEKRELAVEIADTQHGLDLRLLNPRGCFAAGDVNLEIELSDGNAKQPVGGATVEVCLEHENQRIPCAEASTDAKGCAALKFPMPSNAAEGSSLLVRATHGARTGELRFRLKSKPHEKSPATVSR
jgi:hypothetical protein